MDNLLLKNLETIRDKEQKIIDSGLYWLMTVGMAILGLLYVFPKGIMHGLIFLFSPFIFVIAYFIIKFFMKKHLLLVESYQFQINEFRDNTEQALSDATS